MTVAISSRPYLIRALYDWIVDNNWVPHLLVNAMIPEVQIPERYINADGNVILNISPDAVRGLLMTNERIIFTTRFEGVATQICIPPIAIKAIYAKENGEGLVFPEEPSLETAGESTDAPEKNADGPLASPKGLYLAGVEQKSISSPSLKSTSSTSPVKSSAPTKHRKPILKVVK